MATKTGEKKQRKLEEMKKLETATKFLERFGVDVEALEDSEIVEKYDKIQASTAERTKLQILSRGRTLDGIDAILAMVPRGFIGELKRDNQVDIKLAESQGWEIFSTEDGSDEVTPHGTADSSIRFGDQILMFMPEEEYIALHLSREEGKKYRRDRRKVKAGEKVDPGSGSFPIENL